MAQEIKTKLSGNIRQFHYETCTFEHTQCRFKAELLFLKQHVRRIPIRFDHCFLLQMVAPKSNKHLATTVLCKDILNVLGTKMKDNDEKTIVFTLLLDECIFKNRGKVFSCGIANFQTDEMNELKINGPNVEDGNFKLRKKPIVMLERSLDSKGAKVTFINNNDEQKTILTEPFQFGVNCAICFQVKKKSKNVLEITQIFVDYRNGWKLILAELQNVTTNIGKYHCCPFLSPSLCLQLWNMGFEYE